MSEPWGTEQVLALAPDPASAAAGRKLASPGPWSDTGHADDPPAVWGHCRGSGRTPYETAVDLDGPAFRCSCPSRKFPCKHALGLLLLWSGGAVPAGEAPERVVEWTASRRQRERVRDERAAASGSGDGAGDVAGDAATDGDEPDGARTAASQEAARQRADRRAQRVASGLADLDLWLADQVRTGTAALAGGGYAAIDAMAARLVDAQAPGVAAALRRLPASAASGPGWPGRVLADLAALRLTVTASRALDTLPDPLAATVRTRIGLTVAKEDVLAREGVRDEWQVLALRDEAEDRLVTRRVWLTGRRTGRPALVLSFAPPGQPLDTSLLPGRLVDADLHFYPAASPLRALPGTRHRPDRPLTDVVGTTIAQAHAALAEACAADPWTTSRPAVVTGVVPVPGPDGDRWWLVEPGPDGHALPLTVGATPWTLLAVSGGAPVTVAVELTRGGARPLAVHDGTGTVPL